jgi:heterodisulfide reductase subunit B
MKFSMFWGCIAPLRYPGIERATRDVFDALKIDYVDLNGASCCPAPGVFRSFSEPTWLSVGARNLALAEKDGNQLMTICNGCFGSLFEANYELRQNPEILKEVNQILGKIGLKYNGTTEVRHEAEVLYRDIGEDRVKEKVKKELNLDVAVHYGCHFLKPTETRGLGDAERPTLLDEIVGWTGAKSLVYRYKNLCCGAGGGVRARSPEVAKAMTLKKSEAVKAAGADCLLTPCPFCHLQYDGAQPEDGIPVLHISQLLGLAFGLDEKRMGFNYHRIDVSPVLEKLK